MGWLLDVVRLHLLDVVRLRLTPLGTWDHADDADKTDFCGLAATLGYTTETMCTLRIVTFVKPLCSWCLNFLPRRTQRFHKGHNA